ncbi:MAG: GNAT family N-acetyltransferase [Oscillospiraceae bacterium]|nr:GNAT family N-acetyltransferase [Oscillospiraceae bacterium]
MLRKMTAEDRAFFLAAADEFYHTDAVEKPLPMSRLEADFDEIMRSDVYLEGLIFEYDGQRAGYSILTKTFHTEAGLTLWIEDIYILPEFRGKGLGSELFAFLEENYADRFGRFRLEVEEDNLAAVSLYKKNGFRMLPYGQMVRDIHVG